MYYLSNMLKQVYNYNIAKVNFILVTQESVVESLLKLWEEVIWYLRQIAQYSNLNGVTQAMCRKRLKS